MAIDGCPCYWKLYTHASIFFITHPIPVMWLHLTILLTSIHLTIYVSINLNKRGEGDKNKGAAESSIKSVVSVVCPQLLVHCLFWSLLKWNQFRCFNDAQKQPSVTPTPNTAGVLHTLSIPINGRLEKMNDGTSITPLLSHIPNPA